MITLQDVRAGRERTAPQLHVTPLLPATRIGARVGVRLYHKCESLQKTGSFKARGALNRVAVMTSAERERGVITVSAGNHAQALAWAATAAGVRATVVMREGASPSKVEASRGYGAEVVLFGASNIEAFQRARELEAERGLVFVHPFDDPYVAAGAGGCAIEIVEQLPDVDAVVVPIGGGGLISGIAAALRELRPHVRIVGVEPHGSAVMRRSLDAGKPVRLDRIDTIADGLTAPMAGELTYEVISRLVDDVVLVSDDEIADALRLIVNYARLVPEPAAAAATAAILAGRTGVKPGQRAVALLSGGNIDAHRLASLLG